MLNSKPEVKVFESELRAAKMATKSKEPVKIIAVGNPGAGKSTLLNALGREHLFKSGLNIGKGLTYQLDERKNQNGHFLDTPGLADEELRKEAAEAISQGLRMGGQFKILFFVTEQSGRIMQQDATTIQLVHEAAQEIKSDYGIIVNKCSKRVLKMLNQTEAKNDFLNSIFAGIPEENRCVYTNVLFIGRMDDLEDEDDLVVPPETIIGANGVTLENFVCNVVPEISISQEKVHDIDIEKFNEMTRQLEKMATELRLKDETWKEERRQFENQRIKDAEEHKKKMEELLEIERKTAEESRKEKDRLEAKLEEKSKVHDAEMARLMAELKGETGSKARIKSEPEANMQAKKRAESGKFPNSFLVGLAVKTSLSQFIFIEELHFMRTFFVIDIFVKFQL